MKKPFYKIWWVWVLIGIGVYTLIGALFAIGFSNGYISIEDFIVEETTTEETTSIKETPIYENIECEIGKSYTIEGLDFTVTDVVFSEYAGNLNGLNKIDKGMCYCTVYITVKNTSTSTFSTKETFLFTESEKFSYHLIYKNEYSYGDSWCEYSQFLRTVDTIVPLGELQDKVITFKVPEEIKNSTDSLILTISKNTTLDKNAYNFNLR